MTKENLEKEAEGWLNKWELCNKCKNKVDCISNFSYCKKVVLQSYLAGAEPREKRIAELEKKISILLSCKNCPENKGGLLCQKEYENKCLAQKIQFTKELQEENEELKLKLEALEGQTPWKDIKNKSELIKENAELKAQLESERDLPAIAYMQGAEKQKKKDEEELKKWKDEWQEQVQKATDEGYARTLQTMQLTKAKELLKRCYDTYVYEVSVRREIEQFLKDSEVKNDSKSNM